MKPLAPNKTPRILVFSSLFPSPSAPTAGIFIRERMFRIAQTHPLIVVSPKPWSPIDGFIRWRYPDFRPVAPRYEQQNGIDVYAPRFFSLPGIFKRFDSLFMALGSYTTVRRLQRTFQFDLIDAHFAYPDGHAASLLAQWLRAPFTVTLRGSEHTYATMPSFRQRIITGLKNAQQVIGVSQALCQLAIELGAVPAKVTRIANGVDNTAFYQIERATARARFNIADDALILISVGWLIERKGFHRVIACMPELLTRYPQLQYLIIGEATGFDNTPAQLQQQIIALGLTAQVKLLGDMPHDELKWILSTADVFVLATRREGWANVFLEAMACGLPVITTDVGGNAEVVNNPELGTIVPFGDHAALCAAIDAGLNKHWDRAAIKTYAQQNSWDTRIEQLAALFSEIMTNQQRQ